MCIWGHTPQQIVCVCVCVCVRASHRSPILLLSFSFSLPFCSLVRRLAPPEAAAQRYNMPVFLSTYPIPEGARQASGDDARACMCMP